MHALSTHIVCLLLAQVAPENEFQFDRSPADSTPRTVVSAAADAPQYQEPQIQEPQYQEPQFQNRTSNRDEAAPAASPASDTPTVPLHSRSSMSRAVALVDQLIGWDPESLEGDSITLLDCVQRAANSGQQAATVQAYWHLCTAVGWNTQVERELMILAGISPHFEFEQTQIHAAHRSAEARRAQVRVELLAAQEKLAEAAQLPAETLPLPADRPFVGRYQTRLTTMFAGRAVPRHLRRADRALPHQLRLIEQRAEAVDANARLLDELGPLYQQSQVPLAVLLGACNELADQQIAFLEAVVGYNQQIAGYSQAVVGNSLPPESLVSTLIQPRSTTTPRIFRDENVLPATARQSQPRTRSGVNQAGGERTAVNPGNVRPAFEPGVSRRRAPTQPQPPNSEERPPFDPNASFQLNDGP